MTGKSVFIGILISSIFVLIQALPLILISGTARFRGGLYSIMATLWGEKFAGFYIVIYFVANISLAMYALSFCSISAGHRTERADYAGGAAGSDRILHRQPAWH